MSSENVAWIVRAMSEPVFYDHPVTEVELIETHISWVFLAGDFAYKVKKPLNFGFLDFSTLVKRHHYCLEELRLNQRFSDQVYLALTEIGGSEAAPAINKKPTLEYAVKMRRFPQNRQLDRMLAADHLHDRHILAFATKIADLHKLAPPAETGSPYGTPDAVIDPVLENFKQIHKYVKGSESEEQLVKLEQWARNSFEALIPVLRQRKAEGFIRECHGDVHLANMAWFDDQPLLFDCIEFNKNLRWIDVINDIAFLVMDLDDREQTKLAWIFLDRYLQETGDYQGITLLNFYKTYRAMVRAKVTCLRLAQGDLDETQRSHAEGLFKSYLDLADQYILPPTAPLIITHGMSGAGKTTFSSRMARTFGAIHLRSDIERKRLYGLAATDGSGSPIDGGIYSAEASAATYSRLHDLAGSILRAASPVIIDATFIRKQQRENFIRLAEEQRAPLIILDFPRPKESLYGRIEQRAQEPVADASEATLEVLEAQLEHEEPLTDYEQRFAIRVDQDTTAEEVTVTLKKRFLSLDES